VRIAFAGLLVVSLVGKDPTKESLKETPDLEPAVIRVAQAGGLEPFVRRPPLPAPTFLS